LKRAISHFLCLWQFGFRAARKGFRANAGNASIELALVLSVFAAPMMLGTAEAAFMIYDSIEVSNAAHAGAVYGMMSSTFAGDSSGIQAAAQNEATDFGTNLTVTPTIYYACSGSLAGTQYPTQSAANAACPANAANHYLEFVQVASTASVKSPIEVPGLPSTWTLQGFSVMEVQE
jgi:Flp pilus assembly protein TadG